MSKLALMLYTIVAPVFMGVFFTVTLFFEPLTNGFAMIVFVLLGAAAAVPATKRIAAEIESKTKRA